MHGSDKGLQPMIPRAPAAPVEWKVAQDLVHYAEATRYMEARADAIAAGTAAEQVWLVEHPAIYTAGTSAKDHDLVIPLLPVLRTGRGGQVTYHGPGQRVAYVMLDLRRRKPDLRAFVSALENWLVATLGSFAIEARRREGRVGVWVPRPSKPNGPAGEPAEDKIAAIGVRVRRWVTFHGISLNVAPELSHYRGIVPCGIAAPHLGVTSFADLGIAATMHEVDRALESAFVSVFGPIARI
jgi:lipoyl(octanoyl) transferase